MVDLNLTTKMKIAVESLDSENSYLKSSEFERLFDKYGGIKYFDKDSTGEPFLGDQIDNLIFLRIYVKFNICQFTLPGKFQV